MARNFISIKDIDRNAFLQLVDRSMYFANMDRSCHNQLDKRIIGIYFRNTSTRTRTAFSVGALRLGAKIISYSPQDLQINTGETIDDTARVLSGYLDGLVLRSAGPIEEMRVFGSSDEMSVINAMSAEEHPTQAVADYATILAHFGNLEDLHILYLGEGNNTATALAMGAAMVGGMRLTLLTPPGYGLPDDYLKQASLLGQETKSQIEQYHDVAYLPKEVDVVYTTRWQTTGTQKHDIHWREKFRPFFVSPQLMNHVSKSSGTIFMHDLPAHRGEDVHRDVLEGTQSIVYRQARYKLYSAMSILEWCMV